MYCRDSRHFAALCPRKLKAASGQAEINPFKKYQDQGKGKEKEVESGNIQAYNTGSVTPGLPGQSSIHT
jgi:hypothetical protein